MLKTIQDGRENLRNNRKKLLKIGNLREISERKNRRNLKNFRGNSPKIWKNFERIFSQNF